MNRMARSFALIIFLLISILLTLPLVIGKSSLKSQLEQKISQKLGAEFVINGRVEVSFLLLPKISLSNVSVNGLSIDNQYSSDINADRLIIKPRLSSLFSKRIEIRELVFVNPKINNKYDQKSPTGSVNNKSKSESITGQNNLLTSIFNFTNDESFDFKNIKSVQFKNGYLIKKNLNNETTLEFNKINFLLKNNFKKQILIINGNFFSDEVPTSFHLDANTKSNETSSLTIQSPILNLKASGEFFNSNISDIIRSNFTGKIDAEIIDLKTFINKYVSKNNLLFQKINSTQPIKISANINNRAGEIDIQNITINSQSVDGKGNISSNFTYPKPAVDINLDFNNIDIDSIWLAGSLNNNPDIVKYENEIVHKFTSNNLENTNDENKSRLLENNPLISDNKTTERTIGERNIEIRPLFDNLGLTAKITIKTARYQGGDMRDVNINIVSDQNNILLQPLMTNIPGNGVITINGKLERENDIPKLTGEIKIIGKNLQQSLSWFKIQPNNLKPQSLLEYNFKSGLLSLPHFTILNNLNLSINNKNNITGNIMIDDSEKIPSSVTNLKINSFNCDDYFLADQKNQYLSKGSLLKKLLWLNTVSSNLDISLRFDQLTYQGNIFNDQTLKIKFGQGYFKLPDFSFTSPSFDLKGNLEVDITNNNPKLNINLSSNNFQYKSHSNDNYATKTFFDNFFDLPSIDEFKGSASIKINNLLIDNWAANDVKISGNLKDGIMHFDNFTMQTFKGSARYNGSMIFKNTKIISGTLELIGIDNTQLLSSGLGIDNVSGSSNLSAVFNAGAESKTEFFKNLYVSGKFISANIIVKGFGIYDLALKMARPTQYSIELSNPFYILHNQDTKSIFENASGTFATKKGGGGNQFVIKASSLGINGIISGNFDNNGQDIDGNANFIFISGNRQNQVPVNLSINFKSNGNKIEKSTNLSQVEQYLDSLGIKNKKLSTN